MQPLSGDRAKKKPCVVWSKYSSVDLFHYLGVTIRIGT